MNKMIIDKLEEKQELKLKTCKTDVNKITSISHNVMEHEEICDNLNKIYEQKNKKYGDSFGISVSKYGFISALTRMSDKWNRIENLILNREDGSDTDESLEDSLLDLANYCIMTVMELEKQK